MSNIQDKAKLTSVYAIINDEEHSEFINDSLQLLYTKKKNNFLPLVIYICIILIIFSIIIFKPKTIINTDYTVYT